MLPQKNRLKKRKEFAYIYKNGKKISSSHLSLIFIKSKIYNSRIGISVSNKVGNAVKDTGNNMEKDTRATTGNNTYTATRTSTDGRATFMGMNGTAWTWLILGIAAIAIIAVVWYYSMQVTSENNNSRRD